MKFTRVSVFSLVIGRLFLFSIARHLTSDISGDTRLFLYAIDPHFHLGPNSVRHIVSCWNSS